MFNAQSANWFLCVVLTTVGGMGLTSHELATRVSRLQNRHIEVPFGTLVSLSELIGGVALACYWFGVSVAIAIWLLGSLCSFALTILFGGRFQLIWFLGQASFLVWGALRLTEIV
jgi:hypothetical protein